MRQTIELLRKQSIQAGLTSAHIQSMGGHPVNGSNTKLSGSPIKQQNNNGSNDNSIQNGSTMQRHHSTDSMCSLNSVGSNCSSQEKKKKKGWVRIY